MTRSFTTAPDPTRIFMLMNSILARYSRQAMKDLASLQINLTSARVLMQLLDAPNLRCGVVSERCGLDATALSHILRSLDQQELITRQRVKQDNRSVEVSLTPRGREVALQCQEIDDEQLRALLEGLTHGERDHFTQLLARMQDNLGSPETVEASRV